MMATLRCFAVLALAGLAACSAPSASDRVTAAELDAVAPLKRQYPGVVSGFDIRTPDTLTIALDLQSYIDMDDDAVAAMQRHALATWRGEIYARPVTTRRDAVRTAVATSAVAGSVFTESTFTARWERSILR